MGRGTTVPTPNGVGHRVREGLVRIRLVWVEVRTSGANPGCHCADVAVLTFDRWVRPLALIPTRFVDLGLVLVMPS